MPTIEGTVERITYRDEDDTYTVARLQQDAKPSLTTIVGYLPGICVGETLRLTGDWIDHPEYGQQFQIEGMERISPSTLVGMERYLGSGLIKGIGPATARKIVRAFGLASLEIIRAKPEKLTKIEGIGPKKADRIAQAVAAQKEISDIMIFLQGCGVTPAMAAKIYKAYGRHAVSLIKENPYRLAEDVYGIGFKTADRVATQLGVPTSSPHRIKAGLVYLLNEYCRDGHVFALEEQFSRDAAEELGVETRLVREAVSALLDQGAFGAEADPEKGNLLYPAFLHQAEKSVAERLLAMLRTTPARRADYSSVLTQIEAAGGLALAEQQRQAVLAAAGSPVCIITGGPGTGKTTAIRSLIQVYTALGMRFLLAAPTGRAAKRLAEATGHDARTVHRLLEFSYNMGRPEFQRRENNPLEAEALILDEASMIDLPLFYDILKAMGPGTRLTLVGDADQLPPVGPGNVLHDLIDSGVIPTVRLEAVFRQAESSLIITNAHRINRGLMPIAPPGEKDFFFISCEEPEKIAAQIVELVKTRLPRYLGCDPIEDIQVLAAMRRTVTGVDHLNQLLQEELNPATPSRAEIRYGASVFREHDKVMQMRNNYQKMVFNGDMGRIRLADREEGQIHVAFPEAGGEKLVIYDRDELDELVPSYAISVHKSQGSEYPVVVLPMTTQHFMMLQRNLLYTAVTRARRLVVLVGTKKALAIAVRNNKVEERHTRLAHRLRRG